MGIYEKYCYTDKCGCKTIDWYRESMWANSEHFVRREKVRCELHESEWEINNMIKAHVRKFGVKVNIE